MKKFLITISPICAILFVAMWLSFGLKDALLSVVGGMMSAVAFIFGFVKLVEFVDKHIKD
jgi:hypothetical protein